MKFCGLFSSSFVAGLAEVKKTFDYTKHMLDLGTDGGFFSFSTPDLTLGGFGIVFALRRSTIDFVVNFLAFGVALDGFFALVGTQIPRIPVNTFFFPVKELRHLRYIMNIGSRYFQMMNQARIPIHTYMRLVAEVPIVSLLGLFGFGVALFFPCSWWRMALQ